MVSESQGVRFTMTLWPRGTGSCLVCLLWGLIGAVSVEGKITPPVQSSSLVGNSSVVDKARHNQENRRDPFKPIKKRMPPPRVSIKSHPVPTIVPHVEDPAWKLLGVMHGHDDPQAVIQLSPKDRVVVQPGSKLTQSGWTIKTISEEGVLLERLSSNPSVELSSPPRNFILSFPSIPQSP